MGSVVNVQTVRDSVAWSLAKKANLRGVGRCGAGLLSHPTQGGGCDVPAFAAVGDDGKRRLVVSSQNADHRRVAVGLKLHLVPDSEL